MLTPTRRSDVEIAMEPLTPDDLLIRHRPVDENSWLDGNSESPEPKPQIPLERFQTLEHLLRDNPINVDPYLELARIYLKSSRWTDAKRVLDSAVERFPENEQANFLREEAQIARSLQLVSESQAEHDAEPTRLTKESLDRCYLELNVLREKICRSRLARHPEQIELNMPLATALENLGDRDGAIACLQAAIVQPKLRAQAALQLGQLYERAQRIPDALSSYRRCAMFRVPPPTPELKLKALSLAADLAQRSGLVDSALRYVQMLVELEPDNTAHHARATELAKLEL